MSYFPKPSLNENDLAIIERGNTAAHSIEAGQYVVWRGKIGKTKAAILQGTTLDDTLFDYNDDGLLNSLIGTFDGTAVDSSSVSHTATPVNDISYDSTNKVLLLKTGGADTVIPFDGAKAPVLKKQQTAMTSTSFTATIGKMYLLIGAMLNDTYFNYSGCNTITNYGYITSGRRDGNIANVHAYLVKATSTTISCWWTGYGGGEIGFYAYEI